MTDTPSFLRRKPRDHATLDTGIRDIIANLNASADNDTAEVLAGAVNLYTSAMLRFRGDAVFHALDIQQLFSIWTTVLDVRVAPAPDYAARSSGPKSGPSNATEGANE